MQLEPLTPLIFQVFGPFPFIVFVIIFEFLGYLKAAEFNLDLICFLVQNTSLQYLHLGFLSSAHSAKPPSHNCRNILEALGL